MRSLVARVCVSVFLAGASAWTPAMAGPVMHSIVPGDTLWSIAARYHVSVAALEAQNHLTDSSILQLGQVIEIGSQVTSPVATVHKSAPKPHAASRRVSQAHQAHHAHVVRQTLARLATPVPNAARNAMWVATHTGQAPAPPTPITVAVAENILALDERVTHTALRYIGVPYVWGGTTFSGVDCSGFVQAVFEHNGIELPRTADSQFDVGRPVRNGDLMPGDLVFFETYAEGASHVGIYLGGGRFVHASASDGVRIDDLGMDYYAERYIGARRLIH